MRIFLPVEIEASEIELSGERYLVIRAGQFLTAQPEEPEHKQPPAAPPVPRAHKTPRGAPKRQAKRTAPSRIDSAPAASNRAERGVTRHKILSLLEKQPLISGELIEKTRLPSSQIYSYLNILRSEGIIETAPPDDLNRRCNRIVPGKAAHA